MKKIIILSSLFTFGFFAGTAGIDAKYIIPVIVVVLLLYYGYYLNIMFFTKNVNLVERYLHKRRNNPYYAVMIALANKDFEAAEQNLNRLSSLYNQTKMVIKASILLETNQLEEAEKIIGQIKTESAKNHYLALLGLVNGDWNLFNKSKALLKNQTLVHSLEAEAAFQRGDFQEADSSGTLAINSSGGFQKWVLVKSLEYQKNNPDRRSFF